MDAGDAGAADTDAVGAGTDAVTHREGVIASACAGANRHGAAGSSACAKAADAR